MKGHLIFALILLCAAWTALAACPIPKGKEIQHYLKERDLNPKISVETLTFTLENLPAIILHAPISCGLQGCDYMILVQENDNCMTEAFSFSGRYIPLKSGEWEKLEIKFKTTAVDISNKTPRLYFFNKGTKTFLAIPKPL